MVAEILDNRRKKVACIFYSFLSYFLLEELVGPEKGQDVVKKKRRAAV